LERWFASDLLTLSNLIQPLILRRIKEQVVRDLPIKKEIMLYTGISVTQKRLYRALLTRDWAAVAGGKRQALSNVLMQLRKCVNHPYLFAGVEPEPFEQGEHLVNESGKLWMLDKLLALLYRRRHKVLIFSQFTGMLDILQDYMHYRSYNYERLDGSVRGEERYLAIDRFHGRQSSAGGDEAADGGEQPFVFLLSTRAGGVGLNLTGADVVVFYDSDFNPQMDLQAAARAHRIGQTKPVLVCRLVSRGTVEELIIKRAQRKLLLTKEVLRDDAAKSSSDSSGSSSGLPSEPEEISEMLKFGLGDLLGSENQSSIDDKDLRQIDVIEQTAIEASTLQEAAGKSTATGTLSPPAAESIYVYGGVDYSKVL
jgi:SNF2 family DNA or RNA helicase